MALFHDSAIAGASGQAAGGAYKIERSLRFNSSDSAYLSRTPASAGNRTTWTWSGWLKRSALQSGTTNTYMQVFSAGTGATARDVFFFDTDTDDTLAFYSANGIAGAATLMFRTNAVFRDSSSWYHVVLTLDTTQATAANRFKLYINGSEQTFSTVNYPAQNAQGFINLNNAHYLSTHPPLGEYFSGYLADIHFIDGQALDPTSFAETNITTGQWVPKAYTGTYGTNGFRLAFADNSNNTATTLGKDSSPNGNNWTPNNLSVTAGAGNDSLVDTPTSYGTDTGAGGEVRGNYCTLNPLGTAGATPTNGNLSVSSGSTVGNRISTFFLTSGKWYWEGSGNGYVGAIVGRGGEGFTGSISATGSKAIGWWEGGPVYWDGGDNGGGTTFTSTDVIGIALDMDAGNVKFYKNNSLIYTITFGSGTVPNLSSGVFPAYNIGLSPKSVDLNFGQRPFAYTAPSGFKALCDTNLPAPVVAKPNSVFDVKLYTGNGSTQTISGLGFSPDLVWVKQRDGGEWNILTDAVRGDQKSLFTNATNAEDTGRGISLQSSGFSLDSWVGVNTNAGSYVAWAWDAGSSTVTNTQGSITSQVRANASAGFSIVTYSQGSTNGTVGHGLGIAPAFIIVKSRTVSGTNWPCYHISLGKDLPLQLSTTSAQISASNYWGTSAPSSTIFGVGTAGSQDNNNGDMVAYCFAPVAGYSSFGSYTGTGSTDGPFIYTGFRSRWVLIKKSSSTSSWYILDTARDLYNQSGLYLYPDLSNAEDDQRSVYPWDILSNGFKPRAASGSVINDNGATYIYAAFAENPFQFARAR